MDTSRNISLERSAIASSDMSEWARQASRICSATVMTGLSAFMALCMTTESSRQRMCRSRRSVISTISDPWNFTLPPITPAGGFRSWAMA